VQNTDQTVLVTGATGRQGGAVLRHMLTKGWKLRALTRHRDGYAAQKLADRGVELVQGDLEDPAALASASREAFTVFSVFKISGQSERGMRRNKAKTLLRPQRKSRVEHFVYSSVGGAERNSGIDHWESK
jgi:uncharacterized protein YbjT (DUF2867 family)